MKVEVNNLIIEDSDFNIQNNALLEITGGTAVGESDGITAKLNKVTITIETRLKDSDLSDFLQEVGFDVTRLLHSSKRYVSLRQYIEDQIIEKVQDYYANELCDEYGERQYDACKENAG